MPNATDPFFRFFDHVQVGDDCWERDGYRNVKGYGLFKLNGRTMGAHRASWILWSGQPIPEGMHVLHHCDNPACVRPSHLWLGTNRDNRLDCVAKGRDVFASRDACSAGHEYTEENTRWRGGTRHCRACQRRWKEDYYRRKYGS